MYNKSNALARLTRFGNLFLIILMLFSVLGSNLFPALAAPPGVAFQVTTTPTATNTPGPSDLLFANSFEDDDCFTTQWSSCFDDGGDIRFDPPALTEPLGGASMNAILDDNNAIYVTSDQPNAEPRYRARFYFNPNSIVMGKNDQHVIFNAYKDATKSMLTVQIRRIGTNSYQFRAGLLLDNNKWAYTGWSAISKTWNSIELDWRAATAVGANNGGLTLWLDGAQVADLTGSDNDQQKVDWVAMGAVEGIDTGTRGTYYFDTFESRRQNYIGP